MKKPVEDRHNFIPGSSLREAGARYKLIFSAGRLVSVLSFNGFFFCANVSDFAEDFLLLILSFIEERRVRVRQNRASRPQCMRKKRKEALHELSESEVHSRAESGVAPPQSKTLARWLGGPTIRQVLDCAALDLPRGPNARSQGPSSPWTVPTPDFPRRGANVRPCHISSPPGRG